jgi:hypothetical protein
MRSAVRETRRGRANHQSPITNHQSLITNHFFSDSRFFVTEQSVGADRIPLWDLAASAHLPQGLPLVAVLRGTRHVRVPCPRFLESGVFDIEGSSRGIVAQADTRGKRFLPDAGHVNRVRGPAEPGLPPIRKPDNRAGIGRHRSPAGRHGDTGSESA